MKKIITYIMATTIIITSLTSCHPGEVQYAREVPDNIYETDTLNNLVDDVKSPDIAISGALEEENQIALLKFYTELLSNITSDNQENTMISPLSIATALSMTIHGADRETLTEMEDMLGLSKEAISSYLSSYIDSLHNSEKSKFYMANSILIRDIPNLIVNENFLVTNKVYFNPDIYNSKFDDTTKDEINDWVNTSTNGMIDKILEEEITEDEMLYLINALAFEAEWENIYQDIQINNGDFNNLDGSKTQVEFMHSSEKQYLQGDTFTGFTKPYKDNHYSFVGLLPNTDNLPQDVILEISNNPSEFLLLLETSDIFADNIVIPKFEQEYSTELSTILKTMGMTLAFDTRTAQFNKMAILIEENLAISKIIHKTYINVDEQGTKAGAVTAVAMSAGRAMDMTEYRQVRLDKPFVYMIIDNNQKLPLFMGVINKF